MLSFIGFYVYKLVKVRVINTRLTKFKKILKHCTQACSCIVLVFYAALGGPSWFLPLGKTENFRRVSPSVGYLIP